MPFSWSNSPSHSHAQLPEPKRISTPAGKRLSVVLESAHSARDGNRRSRRSEEEKTSGYSYNVWSDAEEKLIAFKNHEGVQRWWRVVAIVLAVLLVIVIALAVGLVVGLKGKGDNSSSSSSTSSPNNNHASNPTSTTTSPSPLISTPSNLPANFPIGTYSLVTFLDTVQTNCSAASAAWSCYPDTTYYTDKQASAATFEWTITPGPSSTSYKVSTSNNPFGMNFSNAAMDVLDAGKDSERYRFLITATKSVTPTSNITSDGAPTQCKFYNTNLQAVLYTKKAREWPNTASGDPSGNPAHSTWPFAVSIEQSASGGDNVPSCYRQSNTQQINLQSQDHSTLCSCLWKNWRTPS